jgi:hypothetical protein
MSESDIRFEHLVQLDKNLFILVLSTPDISPLSVYQHYDSFTDVSTYDVYKNVHGLDKCELLAQGISEEEMLKHLPLS